MQTWTVSVGQQPHCLPMDSVFMHLRYVRCQTCSRAYCCVSHRIEHERRAHPESRAASSAARHRFRSAMAFDGHRTETAVADVPAAPLPPLAPVIRRRFRPAGSAEVRRDAATAVNGRKRLHQAAIGACAPQAPVDRGRPTETPARATLKAVRRVSLSTPATGLRGTSEAAVPPPTFTPPAGAAASPAASMPPAGVEAPQSASVGEAPPQPASTPLAGVDAPHPAFTPSAEVAASPPPSTSSAGVAAPQLSDSPDSFYQTPMQTPDVSPIDRDDCDRHDAVCCGGSAVKAAVSLGRNSTQKGFFWTNMARRFRLALRPAQPANAHVGGVPSPPVAAVADMAKFYGNIQPRRPIHESECASPGVRARPALDDLRLAHEEAGRRAHRVDDDRDGRRESSRAPARPTHSAAAAAAAAIDRLPLATDF